jgi:GNAT superfamily N-acetyltransferase
MDDSETRFEIQEGEVVRLEMWSQDSLTLYWHRDRRPPSLSRERLNRLDLALIHLDYLQAIPDGSLMARTSFFRLIHRDQAVPPAGLPPGFHVADVSVDREAHPVSELIEKCYDDLQLGVEIVQSWANHPVFAPDLWIWVVDQEMDAPVGLGIAEYDPTIREGSLEWIQVLPAYRGKGLGKAIVLELLVRLYERAAFVTVSGRVDSLTSPERLYRRCGFHGNDVWWVLRR